MIRGSGSLFAYRKWPTSKMRPIFTGLDHRRAPAILRQERFWVVHARDPGSALLLQRLDPVTRVSRGQHLRILHFASQPAPCRRQRCHIFKEMCDPLFWEIEEQTFHEPDEMGLCWPGEAKGTCVHAGPNQHHLAHRMLSYHTQEPAFLPCKPGCPGIREKPICSFLLARSYRRDPASSRRQAILPGQLICHVLLLLMLHLAPPLSVVHFA